METPAPGAPESDPTMPGDAVTGVPVLPEHIGRHRTPDDLEATGEIASPADPPAEDRLANLEAMTAQIGGMVAENTMAVAGMAQMFGLGRRAPAAAAADNRPPYAPGQAPKTYRAGVSIPVPRDGTTDRTVPPLDDIGLGRTPLSPRAFVLRPDGSREYVDSTAYSTVHDWESDDGTLPLPGGGRASAVPIPDAAKGEPGSTEASKLWWLGRHRQDRRLGWVRHELAEREAKGRRGRAAAQAARRRDQAAADQEARDTANPPGLLRRAVRRVRANIEADRAVARRNYEENLQPAPLDRRGRTGPDGRQVFPHN